ncbi:MAG: hypothetical protein JNK15_12415, partial [Planctomycetes bacterium]|nr:hypothetical protein [Planctomycetota bacterium]
MFLFTFPALAQDGVQVWIKDLLQKKDDAELALVEKIAGVRSREAAVGLVEAYDGLQTLLYRREVIRGLHNYANLAEAEQPALEKLANIAGNPDTDAELRDFAIQGLGKSNGLGRTFLQRLVDGELPDAVREAALREHVKGATAQDGTWYRFLWNYKQEQRKDKKGEIAPPEFNTVRQLAAQGLLQFLTEAEIVETLKREVDPKIRRALLTTMRQKQMPRTAEIAAEQLDSVVLPGAERAEAARIL